VDYHILEYNPDCTIIIFGDATRKQGDGVELTINKSERSIQVSGWYDNIYGIEGGDIKLEDIIRLFEEEA